MEGPRKTLNRIARAAMVAASVAGAAEIAVPREVEAAPFQSYGQIAPETAETGNLLKTAEQVYSLLGIGRGEGIFSLDMIKMNLQNGDMKVLGYAGIATGVQMGLRKIIKEGTISQHMPAIENARKLIESSSLPEPTKDSLRISFDEIRTMAK